MWTAYYNDNTNLEQFNLDNSENLFSDIDQDKLIKFVVQTENDNIAIVNLVNGDIMVNDQVFCFEIKSEPRLIYFRRNYLTLSTGLDINNKQVYEHIGWQTTTDDGKNKKIIFGLYDDHVKVITND